MPQQLGTDELSKLWTAFQSKFRVSAAYAVSVVLIETRTPVVAATAGPSHATWSCPFPRADHHAVSPQIIVMAPGAAITLSGSNLTGRNTVVIFGGNPGAPQTPALIGDGASASVPLPAHTAGINTLRVVAADRPRRAAEDFAGRIKRRVVRPPAGDRRRRRRRTNLITVGAPDPNVTPPRVAVTLTVDPAIVNTQKIALLAERADAARGPGPALPTSSTRPRPTSRHPTRSSWNTQGVPAGDYLVRVRVDGADSPLDIDRASTHVVRHSRRATF